MKIATWNVERLKHKNSLKEIIAACEQVKADILILTETDAQIHPEYKYSFHSAPLSEINPILYKSTENRVSIYTNYRCLQVQQTSDKYTSLCVELETEKGNLLVYGTIFGIYGNRNSMFMCELSQQLNDLENLALKKNVCVAGDFNCSFADNYYYTKAGRSVIDKTFSVLNIDLITRNRLECIDHIAISNLLTADAYIQIDEWNFEKRLSDHKGIMASLSYELKK